MNWFASLVLGVSLAPSAYFQIGGGSAAYGRMDQSGYERARQAELSKRNIGKETDGRYLEASVLMNVEADEYVAVFAVSGEGKTVGDARNAINTSLNNFGTRLSALKVASRDSYIDFVAQTRIYAFNDAGNDYVREDLEGFEVKQNISVKYRDKKSLDPLLQAAADSGIFDLVKVDYVIEDMEKVQDRLMLEASKIIRRRASEAETLFGVKANVNGVYPPQFSVYYPSEMYDSYQAQESENLSTYRPNQVVQRARKPRTFFYHGLDGKDFDVVLGPAIVEPMVQATVYVRVKY